MRGQVLQSDAGGGLVLGEDGNRYRFATGEWKGATPPSAGASVDFVIDGNSAREVFALFPPGGAAPTVPDRGNSELLGALGIACLALNFVFPVLPLVLALILGLVGASSARTFRNRSGLVLSRIAWIGAVLLLVLLAALITFGISVALPFFHEFLGDLRLYTQKGGTVI
jgi:hypothetical protein